MTAALPVARGIAPPTTGFDDPLDIGEVATWVWDVRTDRVTADRHLARLFGVSDADSFGGPLAAYVAAIHPDDRALTEDRIRHALATGTNYEAAYRVRDAAGRYRYVVARGRVEYGPDGAPTLLPGVVVDLTRRHEAEAAARDAEGQYRTLFAAIDQGCAVIQVLFENDCPVDYRYLETNPAFERHTGLSGVTGQTMRAVAPAHNDRWLEVYGRVAQTGRPERFEDTTPAAGGRWFDVSVVPIGAGDRVAALFRDVTARKMAEAELFASRETLRAVLDGIPQRVFWKAPDLTYLGCNRSFARDMGYGSPEQVVGKDDFQGPWAEMAEGFRTIDRQVISTGVATLDYEEVLTSSDGSKEWVRTSKQPLRGPDGRVVGLLGTYEVITSHKRAEAAVRASEARFRTLVESLPDAVFINADGRVAFCNPACLQLLGATEPGQVLGRSPFDLHPPAWHHLIRDRQAEMAATGRPVSEVEEEVLRVDGTAVPVLVTALPITDGGTDAVLVVLRDISERKRVERRLRDQEAILREAAELAHVGGWGFDPVTLEAEWTDETARIHGIGPDGSADGVSEWLTRYTDDDRRRLEVAIRAAVEHGTPYDLELDFTAVDGVKKRVRAICRPVVENGKVVWVRGSLQDVTERHRLEEQFRQSRRMEAFGQLAGGVAHDFNNLLTVINGYCDILLDQFRSSDPNRRLLSEVRKAGERSAALTRQLLAFSRKQVVAPRLLDLNAVVGDLTSLLRRLIGEDIRLDTAFDPEVWPVLADPGQVEQVLMNLCVNARDAMPTGGLLTVATTNAEVSADEAVAHPDAQPGSHAVLAVTDTGCGMPPEVQARIFEPFYTTKAVGQGTGLGLASVHGIVTQAGGHIRVASRVGGGSTFAVYLPRAGAAEVAEDMETRSGIRRPARGKETVLVVEDEDGVRAFVRAVLEGCGYRVLEAADGEQAVAAAVAHSGAVHLLMTDVVMPGAGGWAAAEQVAARHPGVRVLFVSGYTDDAVVKHGVRADQVHFLQKPFSPAALSSKVRQVLDTPEAYSYSRG